MTAKGIIVCLINVQTAAYYSKRSGRLELQETFPLVFLKGDLKTVGYFVQKRRTKIVFLRSYRSVRRSNVYLQGF